jgi:beta-lactamase class A
MTARSALARAIGDIFVRSGDREEARQHALENELARIAESAGGHVGAAALHLESGRTVSFQGSVRCPLASTIKIPIALQLLARADRGEVALDTMIAIEPRHLRPGAGILARRFCIPGVALSVRNLLDLALVVSDNTAADLILDLAGGVPAVVEHLQTLGISDMSIDRTILQLLADVEGITDLPPDSGTSPEQWRTLKTMVPPERRHAAERALFSDVRDTATPDAMIQLLAAIWHATALGRGATSLLLDILARCETGEDRLKGLLPPGTRVAHKTGTIEGSTGRGARLPRVVNDVGIVDLPDGAGHIALAVFITASPRDAQAQARVIARIARKIYDSFLAAPD